MTGARGTAVVAFAGVAAVGAAVLLAPSAAHVAAAPDTVRVVASRTAAPARAVAAPVAAVTAGGAPVAASSPLLIENIWVPPVPPADDDSLPAMLRGSPDRTAPPTTANEGLGGVADATPVEGTALPAP